MIFSLHIRSMWETICDAQAGFWLNSKFLSKFSRKPLSGISDQKAPPPPHFGKLQIWDDQSLLRNTPPPILENFQIWDDQSLLWNTPPPFQKPSDLRWPKFTLEYPLPPILENFRFEMTKVYSGIPPLPHFGKLQIWDDQSLLRNSPPPFWKMREIVCGD